MPTYQLKDSQVDAIQLEDSDESRRDVINFGKGFVTWGALPLLIVTTPDGQRDLHVGEFLVEIADDCFVIRSADEFLDKYREID